MEAWRKMGKALRRYVNPGTFPLAIKFLQEAEELPEDARSPGRDLQVKLAHCQAQAIARKYGWTLVLTPEDLGCAISVQISNREAKNEKLSELKLHE